MPRHGRPLSFALSALLALVTSTLAGPLDPALRDLLATTDLGGAHIGVRVVDTATGDVLASLNADDQFIPASNQKLLTSAAALITLSPEFVFETDLLLDGSTLVIKGSGDPALADPELLSRSEPPMTAADLLDSLASAVIAAGVDRLDAVIADDRVFDREWAHPSWPADQLNRWYCAQVGAINFHTNVIAVYPSPSRDGAGSPPHVEIDPALAPVEMNNRARTTSSGRNTIWIARPVPANDFTLYGSISRPATAPILAAIDEPPTFAAALLARTLASRGVSFPGARPDEHVRLADAVETFDEATTLVRIKTTLHDVLKRCNTDSHNLYAESLFKRVGHEVTSDAGSWTNAAAVLRMLLAERLGPEHASSTIIADGSGMSRDNRVSPSTLAAWLDMVADDPDLFEPFAASLAAPGEGTLTSRFRDVKLDNVVRAKSGYLDGVYSLSGYVIHPSGRTIAFSLLLNETERHTGNAKRFHESFVDKIDSWLTRQTPVTAEAPSD